MKIKSLLLGSAAALVAVSGARAADAVVIPEPEAVQYVRVCDAAGTGYFYIPGTETCLKIGGYLRYDIGVGDLFGNQAPTGDVPDGILADTYYKNARAMLDVSTYRDTDYGALKTYAQLRFNSGNQTPYGATILGPVIAAAGLPSFGYETRDTWSLNFAYIDLGGLRIGKSESLFTTFTGYAGSVIQDTIGGGYGPFGTNLIQYTYSSGAFTAAIAMEEGVSSHWNPINFVAGNPSVSGWGIDDYVPHIVVGMGYDAGMVNLTGVVGWDSRDDYNDLGLAATVKRGGFAAKIRGDVDISDAASAFVMVMYGENSSAYTTWANGTGDATWSVIGGGTINATDNAAINGQLQWTEANGGDAIWGGSANVAYTVTPGFVVTPEVGFVNTAGDTTWGGWLRFQASF